MCRIVIKMTVFVMVLFFLVLMHESAAAFSGAEELDCENGRKPIGDLGINDLSMKGSLGIYTEPKDEFVWHFQAEPKIQGIDPHGPAAGKLKKGDVIVAIDGMLITTRKAGIRFANTVPGEPVELTIRRRGRTIDTEITPVAVCLEDHPLLFSNALRHADVELEHLSITLEELSKAGLDMPELDGIHIELPELPRMPELPEFDFRPSAWFGMGISCDGCTIKRSKDDKPAQWSFDKPPSIHSLDPGGPADEAGLREGDVLTHIDGIPLDSRKGGKRFSSLEPNETVTWTIKRDGKKQEVEMVAIAHPEPDPLDHSDSHIHIGSFPLRFSGKLGGAGVEVHGKSSVRVTEDEARREIVIKTRDATIRIHLFDDED